MDELQPASITLAKKKGSCSQRFVCLEALARAKEIPTRVRGLWIRGRFWARRFPFMKSFIPRTILLERVASLCTLGRHGPQAGPLNVYVCSYLQTALAMPQFQIDADWLGVGELFGAIATIARQNPHGFSNDSESLFDAISHTAVDFDGKSADCSGVQCDLSQLVERPAGIFESRDDLFALILYSKTLCAEEYLS